MELNEKLSEVFLTNLLEQIKSPTIITVGLFVIMSKTWQALLVSLTLV